MNDVRHYDPFDGILEECDDIQLELEDVCESFEILIFEVETEVSDITEMLERIQDHLEQVKKSYCRCTRGSLIKPQEAFDQESL